MAGAAAPEVKKGKRKTRGVPSGEGASSSGRYGFGFLLLVALFCYVD
jgi:hypothetical protein